MKTLALIFTVFILLTLTALGMGAYNVAATDEHWGVTQSLIEWVRDSSTEARSEGIEVPDLSDSEIIALGAEEYDEMCAVCHLKPGSEATELAQGLYPAAPAFYQFDPESEEDGGIDDDEYAEWFWITKNGLKMTGMPAWGVTHSDQKIWAMTAFVGKLPGMTAEQYAEWVERGEADEGGHSHGHEQNEPAHDHGEHEH